MAFPKLILTGSVAQRRITGIGITYKDDSSGEVKPAYINRLKYTVRRVLTKDNVNSGTSSIKKNVPYDYCRVVHNWVGYIDVLTQSVVGSNSSTPQEQTNVDLLRSAILLDDSAVSYSFKRFNNNQQGIGNLSAGEEFYRGDDNAPSWTYKIVAGTPSTVQAWVIKETSITDNLNNTSRVTFTLEVVEDEESIATIIDT